jgi:uroporphyrin-III C-methyltransferase
VQHASRPEQRQVATSLARLADTVHRERLGSPAIVIVGDVLRAAKCLELGVPQTRVA